MLVSGASVARILLLVAHPDDESIACAGLLQRAAHALVLFAVDGAPPHYNFEKRFGSLEKYSDRRFQEARAALSFVPGCSLRRVTKPDGSYFVDQHLFLELPAAFASLLPIAREFSPDLIVSHAFEGGHLDHDACHVLAKQAGVALRVSALEFPLYWKSAEGRDCFQRFREARANETVLQLSPKELATKQRMLAEYKSQQGITRVFQPEVERFRPMAQEDYRTPAWSEYPFENRRKLLKASLFLRKAADFEEACSERRRSPRALAKASFYAAR
jgi:N-acetylglucosamine malate deacetylase 2